MPCSFPKALDESSDDFFTRKPVFVGDDRSGMENATGGDDDVPVSTITGLSFRLIAMPLRGSAFNSVRRGSEENGALRACVSGTVGRGAIEAEEI